MLFSIRSISSLFFFCDETNLPLPPLIFFDIILSIKEGKQKPACEQKQGTTAVGLSLVSSITPSRLLNENKLIDT